MDFIQLFSAFLKSILMLVANILNFTNDQYESGIISDVTKEFFRN